MNAVTRINAADARETAPATRDVRHAFKILNTVVIDLHNLGGFDTAASFTLPGERLTSAV